MSVINTNQLKSALERLCLVVPTRATLPVLENLRWHAAKGHLELTATDLDNRLHISVPFVGEAIDSNVDALVPAKELCQLVKTESAPNLKIRIRNGKFEVNASKSTVVLSCADPDSFPETPDGELKPQGQILGSAFDTALRRALFCVSTESGRYSTDVLKLELVWSKISNVLKRLGFRSRNFFAQLLSETSRACTIRVRRSSLRRLWNDLGSHACLHHRNRRPGTTTQERISGRGEPDPEGPDQRQVVVIQCRKSYVG